VLGGASPAAAARVQLVVLLALLAVEPASAVVVAELLARSCIAPRRRILIPPAGTAPDARPA
jgi:putative ABC transport system permease protein